MIKACADFDVRGNSYTVDFDAEPWFDHFNHKGEKMVRLLDRYDLYDALDNWIVLNQLCEGLSYPCLEWTIENHPTPELIGIARHEGSKLEISAVNVYVFMDDVRRWLARYKIRMTANTAVDGLLGGDL